MTAIPARPAIYTADGAWHAEPGCVPNATRWEGASVTDLLTSAIGADLLACGLCTPATLLRLDAGAEQQDGPPDLIEADLMLGRLDDGGRVLHVLTACPPARTRGADCLCTRITVLRPDAVHLLEGSGHHLCALRVTLAAACALRGLCGVALLPDELAPGLLDLAVLLAVEVLSPPTDRLTRHLAQTGWTWDWVDYGAVALLADQLRDPPARLPAALRPAR